MCHVSDIIVFLIFEIHFENSFKISFTYGPSLTCDVWNKVRLGVNNGFVVQFPLREVNCLQDCLVVSLESDYLRIALAKEINVIAPHVVVLESLFL